VELQRLTGEEWGKHYNVKLAEGVFRNVQSGQVSIQSLEIMRLTDNGQSVLEIGSGTGESSIHLSLNGRIATALDFSKECLTLTETVASQLQIEVQTCFTDATNALPFAENSFDVVFQAGLLEHFERHERVDLLRNWGIVGKKMISLIPNAACLAYRIGMNRMIRKDVWPYGVELPQFTLQGEFEEAGFRVTDEYSIGRDQGLTFLPIWHPASIALKIANRFAPTDDICSQGYLLVTIGEKKQITNSYDRGPSNVFAPHRGCTFIAQDKSVS